MAFDSLEKALDSLNTLQTNTFEKHKSQIYFMKSELYETEKTLLLKIMPYINEIMQKTSKEIVLSFPEDRKHIIDEYNKYVENERNTGDKITLNEDDIKYLCEFKFFDRDDSYKDKVEILQKKKLNLLQCLQVLQNK